MTCHAGWLWVGISAAAGLSIACGTSPAIGQAGDDGAAAARVAVDELTDGETNGLDSQRIERSFFEADNRSLSSQGRQVGAWKWRSNSTTKSTSKPTSRFNPFGRSKDTPRRDPFIDSDTDAETDPSAESEADSEDTAEVIPPSQPEVKGKRRAAPQSRKRLLRYQTSALSPNQPPVAEPAKRTKQGSPSTSRSESIGKNVSASEVDSESHLRSLFEGSTEIEQVSSQPNDAISKPAESPALDATSVLEIQRVKPRRTITTRVPRTTLPRATEGKSSANASAARARVDQSAEEPAANAPLPTIRPAPKSISQTTSRPAPQLPSAPTAAPTADEPVFGPPLMQSAMHSMRSPVSSSLQSVANRSLQIEPPAGWSATTKPQAQNPGSPSRTGEQVPKVIGDSLPRLEPVGEAAGQLEFPAGASGPGNDTAPTNQQPVTIDSIEDGNSIQTTDAEETPKTLDPALFVHEQSAPNLEPARVQDSFPEPVVIAELARQNQSPWLWWMLSAFGAGFGLCLMWCVWFRKANAE